MDKHASFIHNADKRGWRVRLKSVPVTALVLSSLVLSGCARDMQDLETYVKEIKSRSPPGIEPLPAVKPYERFEYQAENLRNPFDSSVIARLALQADGQINQSGISPDPNHAPEFLESFPLDSLRMVGTLEQSGKTWALVKAPDATVQLITRGDYMGQDNGKVVTISDAGITLTEIVPDGFGGWTQREGLVALSE